MTTLMAGRMSQVSVICFTLRASPPARQAMMPRRVDLIKEAGKYTEELRAGEAVVPQEGGMEEEVATWGQLGASWIFSEAVLEPSRAILGAPTTRGPSRPGPGEKEVGGANHLRPEGWSDSFSGLLMQRPQRPQR